MLEVWPRIRMWRALYTLCRDFGLNSVGTGNPFKVLKEGNKSNVEGPLAATWTSTGVKGG